MKPFEKIMKRPALPNYYRRRIAPYCPPCAGSRGRSCAAASPSPVRGASFPLFRFYDEQFTPVGRIAPAEMLAVHAERLRSLGGHDELALTA